MQLKSILGTIGHSSVTAMSSFVSPVLSLCCAAFFVGREIAQAEYRYIEKHGGKREKCSFLCGLSPSAWTLKAVADCVLPIGIAAISNFI